MGGGTPKCMVYNGQSYYVMDGLAVPSFQETSIYILYISICIYIYYIK
jgi:hypothetical protein